MLTRRASAVRLGSVLVSGHLHEDALQHVDSLYGVAMRLTRRTSCRKRT